MIARLLEVVKTRIAAEAEALEAYDHKFGIAAEAFALLDQAERFAALPEAFTAAEILTLLSELEAASSHYTKLEAAELAELDQRGKA